jgi:hypothetical protein
MSPFAPLPARHGSRTAGSSGGSGGLLLGVLTFCMSSMGCGSSPKGAPPTDAARADAAADSYTISDVARERTSDARLIDDLSDAGADHGPDGAADLAPADDASAKKDAAPEATGSGAIDAEPDIAPPDVSIEDSADAQAVMAVDGGTDTNRDLRIDGGGAIDTGKETAGEAGASRLVTPTVSGTLYTFTAGTTVFAVDSAIGARIVTYSLAGKNILTTPAAGDSSNYGSTFWTSPQSDWSWPPPSQIDPGPYTGAVRSGVLSLTGATASTLGVAVSKAFSMDADTGDVTIQYGIANKGTKARALAPWEISRVAAGGLTFFPMGEGTPQKGSQDLLKLSIVDGVAWLDYDAKTITSDQKVFADGAEGWIAHVAGDLLLVKAFGDSPAAAAAPSEAEVELYTNAGHTYIEVENQGTYASIPANTTSVWTVRWFLRKLDPSVSVAVGSSELLDVVRGLVRGE